MNESDLRVIKTRENIEAAFLTLLSKKPLEKISVVELAKAARINKGTFYLHYMDLFDLYQKTLKRKMEESFQDADFFNDFFDDPEKFCRELGNAFSANLPEVNLLTRNEGLFFTLHDTLDLLREKIYATGRILRCANNDIRLDALFAGILICRPKYEAVHPAEIDSIMLSMISHFQAD